VKPLLLIAIALLTSCSSAEVAPESGKKKGIGSGAVLSGPAPAPYLVGGASPKWKMRTIINSLIRVHEGPDIAVTAVPYSQALLETSVRENVAAAKRNQEMKDRATYYVDETCFIIEVATKEEDPARFNRWDGRLQDSNGKVKAVIFRGGSFIKDLPVSTKKYFPNYEWENSTLACAEKIDLSKPFKLSVTPPPSNLDNEESEHEAIVFSWNL
jgi:hypothetical protein